MAEPYLQFLALLSAPSDFHAHGEIDANHKALFESAVLNWSLGKPLSVLETISQAKLGSPATLHKSLQRLIAQDFVKSESKGQTSAQSSYPQVTRESVTWIGLATSCSGHYPHPNKFQPIALPKVVVGGKNLERMCNGLGRKKTSESLSH
jgi:hypothetical protein